MLIACFIMGTLSGCGGKSAGSPGSGDVSGGAVSAGAVSESYTRIVKIGQRKGDAALEVLLELV